MMCVICVVDDVVVLLFGDVCVCCVLRCFASLLFSFRYVSLLLCLCVDVICDVVA